MTVFRWVVGIVAALLGSASAIAFVIYITADIDVWLKRARQWRRLAWVAMLFWFNVEIWRRVGMLILLHGVLDVWLPLATFLAVASSYIVNFTLNRFWSFGSVEARPSGQAVRYLLLAGVNWVMTVALVSGLAALGMFYLLAKALTVAINAGLNYFAYRHWVFRRPGTSASAG